MLPNEVKNAIPRQKVKNSDGRTMTVLHYSRSEKFVYGIVDGCARTDDINGWELKDCQPVPEEPRPLRVGDNVVALDYAQNPQAYFQIQTLEKKDGKDYAHGSIFGYPLEHIRHATPSEVAQYFN